MALALLAPAGLAAAQDAVDSPATASAAEPVHDEPAAGAPVRPAHPEPAAPVHHDEPRVIVDPAPAERFREAGGDRGPDRDEMRQKVQSIQHEFAAKYKEWKREQRALYLAEAADIRADLRAAIQDVKADWREQVAAWRDTCGATEEPAEGEAPDAATGCGQERAAINRAANRALRAAHEEAQDRKQALHEEFELALQEYREALMDEMRFAIEDLMDDLGAFVGNLGGRFGGGMGGEPHERPMRPMAEPQGGAHCTPEGICKPPQECVGHIGETPECTPPPDCKDLGDGTYQCSGMRAMPAQPQPVRPSGECKYDGTRLVCAGQMGTAGCMKTSDGRVVCEGRPAEGMVLPQMPTGVPMCKFDSAAGKMVCSNTMGSIACHRAADGRITCDGQQGTTAPPPEPQPSEPQPAAAQPAEPEPQPATTASASS